MQIETFNAGTWQQTPYNYAYFLPALVAGQWTWRAPEITQALDKATRALARLDAYSTMVPDLAQFINLHVALEANTSSRIEGTRTEVREAVVEEIELIDAESRDDWQEVRNYVSALNEAVSALKDLPLSMRLSCKVHATLLASGRGQHKTPGEIRTSQNWIGGSGPSSARFVPPAPDRLPELLSDLERLWNAEDLTPPLIRNAIAHYQFETLHPFCDGNGRLGRLLIPLHLISCGLLDKPTLYVSQFFERHRSEYYDALTAVRESNRLDAWVHFFLRAIRETAEDGVVTLSKTLALRTNVSEYCIKLGRRAEIARRAFLEFYAAPRTSARILATKLGEDPVNVRRLLTQFVADGWLTTHPSRDRRLSIYDFTPYLSIFGD